MSPTDEHGSGPARGGHRGRVAVAVAAVAVFAALATWAGIEASSEETEPPAEMETAPATATGSTEAMVAEAVQGVVGILAATGGSGVVEGSGFVLDRRGHILTCEHVVDGTTSVFVSFADGTKAEASVVGTDPLLDLAVLSVDVPRSTLVPLPLGSSDDLELGETVLAIGTPFGLERSVSEGIVSGLERQMTAPNGFTISNAVQTDAAINHGHSGGPLLDGQGLVIGVNAQIAESGVDANVGVAFAVAMDDLAKRAIAEMQRTGSVEHPWLGVALRDIDSILATSGEIPTRSGALVTGLVAGGPADRAGVSPASKLVVVEGVDYCLGGDIITAVDGTQVETVGALQRALVEHDPGDEVALTVTRADGSEDDLSVELGAQPEEAPDAVEGCG